MSEGIGPLGMTVIIVSFVVLMTIAISPFLVTSPDDVFVKYKEKVVPSRDLPERLICKTCDSESTGKKWIFCRYDTEGLGTLEVPGWCDVEDSYIQLDLEDNKNRLFGILDYNTSKVIG